MKCSELKVGMVIVVNNNWFLHDGRPVGHYIVLRGEDGKLVAVNFKGNCNCDERPWGYYDIEEDIHLSDELPWGTIAVYEPTHIQFAFRGDYENPKYYHCLFKDNEMWRDAGGIENF